MKKFTISLIAILLGASQCVFAQNKGDMFISFGLSTDLGFASSRLISSGYSEKSSLVYDPSAGAQVEFGFFPTNNLKLAMALGYGFAADRYYSSTDEKLSNITNEFTINPNVAYYVKIVDRFYYAPEVGVVYGVGSYSEALSASARYSYGLMSYGVYLQPINFEFRVLDHFAIGAGLSDISFVGYIYKNKETDTKLHNNTFSFKLNSAVWLRFYF